MARFHSDDAGMKAHPAAEPFPSMSAGEYAKLKADIDTKSLIEPIVTYKKQILDGRHRFKACQELRIAPRFTEYDGDDPAGYVVSLNLKRRHLSEGQRAMVAARLADMPAHRPSDNSANLQTSQAAAAELLNVSQRSVASAAKVRATGTPDLVAVTESGDIAVSVSAQIAARPAAEQQAIVARVKAGERPGAAFKAVQRENVQPPPPPADKYHVIVIHPPYPKEFIPPYRELAEPACAVPMVAVMCGQSYLPTILHEMSAHLRYRWTLAYLTTGGQAVQLWAGKINTFWKSVILFGDIENGWLGDVCRSDVNDNDNDNDKRYHGWGRSESGMLDLVSRLAVPGSLVCDPYCGGGTTALVALAHGCRFVGCDVDEQAVATARQRVGL